MQGPHEILTLLFPSRLAVHTFELGLISGLFVTLLWRDHRNVSIAFAVLILGTSLARIAVPWIQASGRIAGHLLLFTLPLVTVGTAGVGVRDRLEDRSRTQDDRSTASRQERTDS